jgi:maltose/moltooligosaccharide transporter
MKGCEEMTENIAPKIKMNWKYVIIFGLWGAAWNIIWGVYNNYMPVFWQSGNVNYNVLGASTAVGFGLGAFITGLIMSIDNISNAILGPVFGALADRAKSRKPLVIIFGTLTALFYALLPLGFLNIPAAKSGQFNALMLPFILTVSFAFLMILSWSVALNAENGLRFSIIPSAIRTQVVGYGAVFGGLGFILTFTMSNLFYKIYPALPFWIGSGFLLIVVLCYAFLIKEPAGVTLTGEDEEKAAGLKGIAAGWNLLSGEQKKNIIMIALTKFLIWFGVAGLETFASSYVVNNLGLDEGQAGMMIAIYFLGYLLFAVPAGYISARIGRKTLLRIACIAFIVAGVTQYALHSQILLYAVLVIAGAANSTTDCMILPMVADVAASKKVMGVTLGISSSMVTLASILAVPFWGALIQSLGNDFSILWIGMAVFPALGLILVSTLKKDVGEAKPATAEETKW